ncbi:MAG: hypothetical protein ACRDA9_02375, partial [Plesiomonas shigelloides]
YATMPVVEMAAPATVTESSDPVVLTEVVDILADRLNNSQPASLRAAGDLLGASWCASRNAESD